MTERDLEFPQKVLIVDDELVNNASDREDFILDLEVPEDLALFASSFDEALSIIKETSDIAICFVDSRIPKSNDLYDFDPLNVEHGKIEWGISLIPEINQIQKLAQIVVYSCYVSQSYLVEKAHQYNNIIGFFGKSDGILHRKQLYLDAIEEAKRLFSLPTTISQTPALKPIVDNDNDYEQLEITPVGFDYSSLDPELAQWLQTRTRQIKNLLKRTAQDTIDIGKYITQVKDSLQFGQYEQWVKNELPLSLPTAYRYMRVYERLSAVGIEDVSKLDIFPSALYELTGTKVPDVAILEMKELAESGVKIDTAVAQNLTQKYTKVEKDIQDKSDREPRTRSLSMVDTQLPNNVAAEPETEPVKHKIVGIVRRQDFWELGEHKLLRADPNSDKFIEVLPQNTALSLAFAPDKKWIWNCKKFKSQMLFYSQYQDLDYVSLLEAVKKIIEVTTNEGDTIAICFSPHPRILQLISRLGCQAYIAEPDYEKCVAIVENFSIP